MTNTNPPQKKPHHRPRKRKIGPPLPPAQRSKAVLVRLAPSEMGMFRFLLEAYEHIAYFSVINRHAAHVKVVFSPHRERAALTALHEMAQTMPLEILPWPTSQALA